MCGHVESSLKESQEGVAAVKSTAFLQKSGCGSVGSAAPRAGGGGGGSCDESPTAAVHGRRGQRLLQLVTIFI
jgi:hypothetical protein